MLCTPEGISCESTKNYATTLSFDFDSLPLHEGSEIVDIITLGILDRKMLFSLVMT